MNQQGGNYRPNIYNQYNNNQYKNNQYNNYQNLQRKNQLNSNDQKNIGNKKYKDLEIEAFFDNDLQGNIPPNDPKLENITQQFRAIVDNINNMGSKFSDNNNNIREFNNIKKEFEEIDSYLALEHGKFISDLFDVSKDNKVLDYDYKRYKNNPQDYDEKIKKIISNCKYDAILYVNRNNSKDNINKIKNYIERQTNKNKYSNANNNNNSYKNNNNNNKQLEQKNNNSNQSFNFGSNIYSNNNNGQSFNYINNMNSNQNKKYQNPNEVENEYGNNNNYNPNQYDPNESSKIKVTFIYKNREEIRDYNINECGDLLYYTALELKDEPKICNKKGEFLNYETLRDKKIGELFYDVEPILNIY